MSDLQEEIRARRARLAEIRERRQQLRRKNASTMDKVLDVPKQLGRGIGEGYLRTAVGVNELLGSSEDADYWRDKRKRLREATGESLSAAGTVANLAGQFAYEGAEFMAPGGILTKGAKVLKGLKAGKVLKAGAAARAAKVGERIEKVVHGGSWKKKAAVGTALNAPIDVIKSGAREDSFAGALGDLTGSETLNELADSRTGRAVVEVAGSAAGNALVEKALDKGSRVLKEIRRRRAEKKLHATVDGQPKQLGKGSIITPPPRQRRPEDPVEAASSWARERRATRDRHTPRLREDELPAVDGVDYEVELDPQPRPTPRLLERGAQALELENPAPVDRKRLPARSGAPIEAPGELAPEEQFARARRSALLSRAEKVVANPPSSEEVITSLAAREQLTPEEAIEREVRRRMKQAGVKDRRSNAAAWIEDEVKSQHGRSKYHRPADAPELPPLEVRNHVDGETQALATTQALRDGEANEAQRAAQRAADSEKRYGKTPTPKLLDRVVELMDRIDEMQPKYGSYFKQRVDDDRRILDELEIELRRRGDVADEEGLTLWERAEAHKESRLEREGLDVDEGDADFNPARLGIAGAAIGGGALAEEEEGAAAGALGAAAIVGTPGKPGRFFSRVLRAIEASPMQRATSEQWKALVAKGTSAGERAWMKLDEYFAGKTGPVTKGELLEYAASQRPQISKKVLAEEEIDIPGLPPETQRAINDAERAIDRTDTNIHSILSAWLSQADLDAGNGGYWKDRLLGSDKPDEAIQDFVDEMMNLDEELADAISTGDEVRKERILEHFNALKVNLGKRVQEWHAAHERLGAIELEARALRAANPQRAGPPQYSGYREPGGNRRDYREYLWHYEGGGGPGVGPMEKREFSAPHFMGHQANLVLHARADIRDLNTPKGRERILYVDEIQSDWHQRGRSNMYDTEDQLAKFREKAAALKAEHDELSAAAHAKLVETTAAKNDLWDVTNELHPTIRRGTPEHREMVLRIRQLEVDASRARARADAKQREFDALERKKEKAVPAAPLQQTPEWLGYALKELIDEAVRDGHQRIVITNGTQQAKRWNDAVAQFDRIEWSYNATNDAYALVAHAPGQQHDFDGQLFFPEELEGAIGPHMAQTIRANRDAQVREWEEGREVLLASRLEALEKYYQERQALVLVGDTTHLDSLMARQRQLEADVQEAMQPWFARSTSGEITGADIKMGGEQYIGLYDKILPSVLKDIGKHLGVKLDVEMVDLNAGAGAQPGKWRVTGADVPLERIRAWADQYIDHPAIFNFGGDGEDSSWLERAMREEGGNLARLNVWMRRRFEDMISDLLSQGDDELVPEVQSMARELGWDASEHQKPRAFDEVRDYRFNDPANADITDAQIWTRLKRAYDAGQFDDMEGSFAKEWLDEEILDEAEGGWMNGVLRARVRTRLLELELLNDERENAERIAAAIGAERKVTPISSALPDEQAFLLAEARAREEGQYSPNATYWRNVSLKIREVRHRWADVPSNEEADFDWTEALMEATEDRPDLMTDALRLINDHLPQPTQNLSVKMTPELQQALEAKGGQPYWALAGLPMAPQSEEEIEENPWRSALTIAALAVGGRAIWRSARKGALRPDVLPITNKKKVPGAAATGPSPRPGRPASADAVDENQYANIAKFALDPEGEIRLRRAVQEVVATRGLDPKKVVTWAETERMAATLGLNPQRLEKKRAGRLSGPEMLAIRNIVAENIKALEQVTKELADPLISPDRRAELDRLSDALENQNDALLGRFVEERSQTGRDLNNLKILARHTMDPAVWLMKAKKALGDHPVTQAHHAEILRLINDGDANGLAHFVAKLEEPSWWDKVVTVWKAGLLTSPKTHVANIAGNTSMAVLEAAKDGPATMFDALLGTVTGVRTKHFDPVAIAQASARGAKTGLKEAKQVWRQGYVRGSLEKVDLPREIDFDNPILDTYTKKVFRGLSAMDRVFRGMALQRSLDEQARVLAKQEGATGERYAMRVRQLMAAPTDAMVLTAIADAQLATFQNKGRLGRAAVAVRETLGPVGHVLIPFTMTPANVASRAAEYSPLGAIAAIGELMYRAHKGEVDAAMQKKLVERLGRSSTGTAAVVAGFVLASEGKLTAGRPASLTEADQADLEGKQENAVLIDGKWRSLERLSPLGNLLILGAHLHEAAANPEVTAAGAAARGVAAVGQTVYESRFMRGLDDAREAMTDKTGSKAQRWVNNMAGSVVPTGVAALARAEDPAVREVASPTDAIKNRIPGMRDELPAKVNQLGREVAADGGPMTQLLDPTAARTDQTQTDPLIAELSRVGVKIGRLKRARGEDGRTYNTRAQQDGQLLESALHEAIASDEYAELPDVAASLVARDPTYAGRSARALALELQKDFLDDVITSLRRQRTAERREASTP